MVIASNGSGDSSAKKALYFGVNGTARKVKKMYIGVNGTARKVKKAYIGVNGVARLFFTGQRDLIYTGSSSNGKVAALSQAKGYLMAASVGRYALFAGGYNGSRYNTVDAYNDSLVRSNPTGLSQVRASGAGGQISQYAMFAGGYGSGLTSAVDAYNPSLTRSNPTGLSVAREGLKGAAAGGYLLFAGGYNGSTVYNTVEAYNGSLTRSIPTPLSQAKCRLAAASLGKRALFAGGCTTTNAAMTDACDSVEAYDESLTRSTLTPLSVKKGMIAAASLGKFTLFAGGAGPGGIYSEGCAYDESLTQRTLPYLPQWTYCHAGIGLGDYAIFAGGIGYDSAAQKHIVLEDVAVYNDSLTLTSAAPMSVGRRDFNGLAAATAGDHALIAGGVSSPTSYVYSNAVDVYSLKKE